MNDDMTRHSFSSTTQVSWHQNVSVLGSVGAKDDGICQLDL